mgnify:CR=1 FL=1
MARVVEEVMVLVAVEVTDRAGVEVMVREVVIHMDRAAVKILLILGE